MIKFGKYDIGGTESVLGHALTYDIETTKKKFRSVIKNHGYNYRDSLRLFNDVLNHFEEMNKKRTGYSELAYGEMINFFKVNITQLFYLARLEESDSHEDWYSYLSDTEEARTIGYERVTNDEDYKTLNMFLDDDAEYNDREDYLDNWDYENFT